MQQDQQVLALRKILLTVILKNKVTDKEISAVAEYLAKTAKGQDDAIKRIPSVLPNDLIQMKTLRIKISKLQKQVDNLGQTRQPEQINWPVVRAVFFSIGAIAAIVTFPKAFGLIQLPW